MLREAGGIKRVILACGRTDLRKGMDSLAALVRLAYGLDPLEEGTLFLFCGVKKDRLKGLIFEGIGFCLLTIRLTDGRFQWPSTPDEARDITMEQYLRLMDGFAVESSIRSYRKAEA
jgi:transposase